MSASHQRRNSVAQSRINVRVVCRSGRKIAQRCREVIENDVLRILCATALVASTQIAMQEAQVATEISARTPIESRDVEEILCFFSKRFLNSQQLRCTRLIE
ncbi:hypothetical protein BGV69_09130 [Burkholderia ubonensis]|nr:hypothetical protein BGV69_09130 [Burkholderia ubonensis]